MKNNTSSKKILKKLFSDGYCIVKNVLTDHECDKIVKNLEKLKHKTSNNKYFIDERSDNGQVTIRDLPLRDPNFLNIRKCLFVIINCIDRDFI